jgi:predicted ATPase/transcriptional regulator with XRE-family HTH domain
VGPAEDAQHVGQLLRRLRLQAGLSQAKLARRAHLSAGAIALLETGQRQRPHLHTLELLADALQLSAAERAELVELGRRAGDPAVDPEPVGMLPRSERHLPEPPTQLIGRDDDLRAISQLLTGSPSERLVTLLGPAGVGKTRLAIAAAQALSPAFADGAAFVDLSTLRDERLVPAAVAWAVGLHEAAGLSADDRLAVHLRDQRLLLVLDNFEHVMAAWPVLSQLLAACPSLSVLVTSRTALRVRAEIRFQVEPLAVPDALGQVSPETIAAMPAVRLFVDRARAVSPDFALSSSNARAVADVCRRLEGLPLALELAAARLALLEPQMLLDRLERRLQTLSTGPTDLPGRQRTLRATLDWSQGLLSTVEQVIFRRLAVFAGGWSLAAADNVCADGDLQPPDDVLDGLEGLVSNSLVRRVEPAQGDAEPRFTMLETVREYAAEHLEAGVDLERVRQRHRDFFIELAQTAQTHLTGPDQTIWLDRLEQDADNFRAALNWCLESRQGVVALELAAALWRFWWVRRLGEGRRLMASALDASGDAPPALRATALFGAGMLAWGQTDVVAARGHFEQSLALRRSFGSPQEVAETLNALGIALHLQHADPQAQAAYQESLALYRGLGDDWGTANALAGLAVAARDRGDLREAAALHSESLALRRARGDTHATAKALHDYALVLGRTGDNAGAGVALVESLALYRQIRNWAGTADCLDGLSWLAALQKMTGLSSTWHTAATLVRESVGALPSPADQAAHIQNLIEVQSAVGVQQLTADLARTRKIPLADVLRDAFEAARAFEDSQPEGGPSNSSSIG